MSVKWRRESINIDDEKAIIIGMIVSTPFLREIITILKLELLQVQYVRIVADWCIKYYKEYERAPEATIQEIFESYSRNDAIEESQSELISKFLENISNEYENGKVFNFEYALDKAEIYLKKRKLKSLIGDIKLGLGNDDNIEKIESLITNFRRVERQKTIGINPLTDEIAISKAFDFERNALFSLPGELGKKIGPLSRGNFVAFVGPAGRGKSWWLQEVAFCAIFAGLKVLFVSLEMTEEEFIMRIHSTIAAKPLYTNEEIEIPIFDCIHNKEDTCNLPKRKISNNGKYSPCSACKNKKDSGYKFCVYQKSIKKNKLEAKEAIKRGNYVQKMIKTGKLHLVFFPTKSISILGIKTYIENLEYYNNFIPDVIITDYPDIMAPIPGSKDTRHQINEIWEHHRGIAQARHCVMVVSSHTNKGTFNKRIKQDDLSEEGRKLNHVTHAIAINQSEEEYRQGIQNLSLLKRRHGKLLTGEDIVVLQNLSIGKPYLDSYVKPLLQKGVKDE